MLLRRVALGGAGLIAGASLLSACGGSSNGLSSQSPQKILAATLKALSSASSTHISGTVTTGSQTVTIDMTMFKNGDSDGSFGLSQTPGELLIVGNTIYFKGSAKFWEGLSGSGGAGIPAADAAKLANKWVSLPSSSSSSFASFTLKGFAASLTKSASKLKKVGTKTIDGQQAVGIQGRTQGTLWIAASGTPYPIEAVKSSTSNQHVTFSNWNQGTPPTAPAGAVSIQKLLG
ncbi:MAG: DUF2092 domain-containing protein [Acidimicrobiales bacterium]